MQKYITQQETQVLGFGKALLTGLGEGAKKVADPEEKEA